MKWWPGILAIATSWAIPSVITFLFFIGINWEDYEIHSSRWWQCGVYCSAIWLASIQLFGSQCIQIKVRSSVEYKNYTPSLPIGVFCYICSALFAFMIWAVCYVGAIHPLVQSKALADAGIFSTAILQTKFLVPEKISFKKNIFFLLLLGPMVIMFSILSCLLCIMTYIRSDGFTLCLVFFPIAEEAINMLMRLMISFTNSEFLEPIFIHISALMNNIFFIYALGYNGPDSYDSVVFAGFLKMGRMIHYYLLVTIPLEFYLGLKNKRITLRAWFNRQKPEFPEMTNDERKYALNVRSKYVYILGLEMASQLVLPWWLPLQLAVIMFRTPANTSMVTFGFDTSWRSFIHRFNIALILNGLDLINMTTLTYFIRRKYPLYNPFRILHMIFEQFGLLPIFGIMLVLFSYICFSIKDCGTDPDQVLEFVQSF